MSEWRSVETMPQEGRFLAWHAGTKSAVTVRRFTAWPEEPGAVVEPYSGKFWVTEWWMPAPAAPLAKARGQA